MIQLQLYIEGQEVELHDNESVTLTQSLQDVLDLQKIFTDFSRTFNVPASTLNNKIFKHYYNPSIQGFDARDKKDSELYLNYEFFKSGKIKLESVQMKNNSPINYRITFFGKTIQLKDLLGKDKLSELTNLNAHIQYKSDFIIPRMQSGYNLDVGSQTITDAMIYPLVTHTNRIIYNSADNTAGTYNIHSGSNNHGLPCTELKPAVRIHALILAIEQKYGLKFSTDFFNVSNPAYYNLYLWLSKQKGKLEQEDGNKPLNSGGTIQSLTSTGGSGNRLKAGFSINGGYSNEGSYDGHRYIVVTVNVTAGVEYDLEISANQSIFHSSTQTSTGSDSIIKLSDEKKLLRPTRQYNLAQNPYHYIGIRTNAVATFTVTTSIYSSLNSGGSIATQVKTIPFTINYTTELVNELPDMEVMAFLQGLFKAFNLTAYYSGNTINVTPLDDFYAGSSKVFDITQHIDKTTSEVSSVLPYSKISFEYQGNETFFSAYHNQIYGEKWGALSETVENVPEGEDYIIQLPFEHHKFEKLIDIGGGAAPSVQWGWSVNQEQESYLGKPFLFYAHKITNGTEIAILDSAGGAKTAITSYFIPSNLANPTDVTTQSIHFGEERNEYNGESASKSLFKTYYENYIVESIDTSRRLFKFTAFLPLSVILNIKLQDKVIIFNDLYKINKIVTNFENGKTQLELLNEVLDYNVPINNTIVDVVKTADTTLFTADTTIIRADAGNRRI